MQQLQFVQQISWFVVFRGQNQLFPTTVSALPFFFLFFSADSCLRQDDAFTGDLTPFTLMLTSSLLAIEQPRNGADKSSVRKHRLREVWWEAACFLGRRQKNLLMHKNVTASRVKRARKCVEDKYLLIEVEFLHKGVRKWSHHCHFSRN